MPLAGKYDVPFRCLVSLPRCPVSLPDGTLFTARAAGPGGRGLSDLTAVDRRLVGVALALVVRRQRAVGLLLVRVPLEGLVEPVPAARVLFYFQEQLAEFGAVGGPGGRAVHHLPQELVGPVENGLGPL